MLISVYRGSKSVFRSIPVLCTLVRHAHGCGPRSGGSRFIVCHLREQAGNEESDSWARDCSEQLQKTQNIKDQHYKCIASFFFCILIFLLKSTGQSKEYRAQVSGGKYLEGDWGCLEADPFHVSERSYLILYGIWHTEERRRLWGKRGFTLHYVTFEEKKYCRKSGKFQYNARMAFVGITCVSEASYQTFQLQGAICCVQSVETSLGTHHSRCQKQRALSPREI